MILGKQRARARFREFIGAHLFARKNARVLCLPGENGREVEHVYRKLGFRDENIVGVEMDARAARGVRTHYPRIEVREGELLDVVGDIVTSKSESPFDVVSLDFCGNFSPEKILALSLLQTTGKLADRCIVGTNFFAGREQKHTQLAIRGNYAAHLQSLASSAERAKFVTAGDAWGESIRARAGGAKLNDARDDAIRSAIIQEMTHDGPMLLLSRQYHVTVQEAALDAHLKDRGMSREMRQQLVPMALKEDGGKMLYGPQFALDIRMFEMRKALEALIRAHPGAWRIPESDDPGAVALSFARKAASAFLDEYGQAHVPVAHDGYSYINDAGHKMVSDYFLFQHHADALSALPRSMDIEDDGEIVLAPDPGTFWPPKAYVQYIYELSARYHAIPQLWVQKYKPRVDLGGGALPIDQDGMKAKIVKALKNGRTDDEVMAKFPVTKGTLSALRANITMGRT